MIKHYSKDAVPLPKIEYKKESADTQIQRFEGEGYICMPYML